MKKNVLIGLTVLAAGSLLAADPKDDVTAAAKALGTAASYSWHTTVEMAGDSPFKPGPTDGKTEKGGFTIVTSSFGDNQNQMALKGTNAAIKTQDNGWQTVAELMADGGGGGGFNPGMMFARQAQSFRSPAAEAEALVGQVKELKATDKGISGDLTDDAAKSLMTMGRGRRGGGPGGPGGGGPEIAGAKATVTFTIADGKLTKYQVQTSGKMDFNGEERDMGRTTTTEIKDIGSTKVEVPDDAKKKLQ